MIEARGISKSYCKQVVLENIDFSLASGQSAVIVGRNGTGKSTLLSILAGFLRPDAGSVAKDGKLTAFCPQEDRFFEELTVGDNLKFWGSVSGGCNELADRFAQILGVDTFARKKITQLSGGMKKSTAVCCALSGDPATLILDEPFAGLDIFHKNALLSAFAQLQAAGKCILYSSHSIDEIVGLGSQIYTLANGTLTRFESEQKGIDILEPLLMRI